MEKAVLVLKQIFLILGVIVALTPCGFCHESAQAGGSQMKPCEMGSMSGMKCCQSSKSKPQSPLCKTMNQSSEAPAVHGLGLVAMPVISPTSANVFFLVEAFISPAFSSFSASPPQGHFSLRI